MAAYVYDVYIPIKNVEFYIDTIFTSDNDIESVKKSLIDHDGYSRDIIVKVAED